MVQVPRWHAAILAVVALGLYANTFGHGYALDDGIVILDNEYTQAGLSGLPRLLTEDSFQGFLGKETNPVAGGRYRPLSLVTFAIEIAAFGPQHPFVGHLLNALLYALCCVVLYQVMRSLLAQRTPDAGAWMTLPFAAALLFAVHPLHTEAVANIKSRDEILALLFALASLGLALRAADERRNGPAIAAALCFFLALASKETAIPFLAVIPYSLWFFRTPARPAIARALPPIAIAAVVFLVIRAIVVVGGPEARNDELLNDPFLGATISERYATVFYTLARYVALIVWPHPLTHDYAPYHIAIHSWRDAGPWIGLVLHLGLAGLALSGLRWRTVPAYAAAYYLATLSVVSNLVITTGTFMAERFLFTPSAGAMLGMAWALLVAVDRAAPAAARASTATAVIAGPALALAALTVLRNPAWKDSYTLFSTDIAVSKESALLNANLADMLLIRANETADPAERARIEQSAIGYIETALHVHPRYRNALEMLAVARGRQGDIESEIVALERLVEIDPRRRNAAFNLGTVILEHRPERVADAVRYLELAVKVRPRDADARANLGVAYYKTGDLARAIASFERAVALAPDRADHRANLEQLLAERR
jgi:tetratricopeptide (TPR) repeat protein